jgi:hypothetical protein
LLKTRLEKSTLADFLKSGNCFFINFAQLPSSKNIKLNTSRFFLILLSAKAPLPFTRYRQGRQQNEFPKTHLLLLKSQKYLRSRLS